MMNFRPAFRFQVRDDMPVVSPVIVVRTLSPLSSGCQKNACWQLAVFGDNADRVDNRKVGTKFPVIGGNVKQRSSQWVSFNELHEHYTDRAVIYRSHNVRSEERRVGKECRS